MNALYDLAHLHLSNYALIRVWQRFCFDWKHYGMRFAFLELVQEY
jgi:hypothetical protein